MILLILSFFLDYLILQVFPKSFLLSSYCYPMILISTLSYLSFFSKDKDKVKMYYIFSSIFYGLFILDYFFVTCLIFLVLYFLQGIILYFFKRGFVIYFFQTIVFLFCYDFLIFIFFNLFSSFSFSFSFLFSKVISSIFLNSIFAFLIYEISFLVLKKDFDS